MPALDVHGDIAAATIAFYVPVACLSFFLTLRYGFSRDAGWIFLLTFSLVRIAGGAVLIAAEKVLPPNIGLYTAAYILESVGLAPLMLSTLGFIGLVGQYAFSENPRMRRLLRLVALAVAAAAALAIVGGIDQTSSKPSDQTNGVKYRKAGVILFLAVYVVLVLLHLACWRYRFQMRSNHRTLLTGITAALPFLGVRTIYSVLSAFSGDSPGLHKFNRLTGDWKIFLVMSLIMEYIVVVIYATIGAWFPLRKDYE